MKSRFYLSFVHAYFTHFSLSQQHGFYIDYNILHGDLGNYGNVRKTVNNLTHIDRFFFLRNVDIVLLFCLHKIYFPSFYLSFICIYF